MTSSVTLVRDGAVSMLSQPLPKRPTLREIFWALLHVTFTTANGVIYFSGVVTATWVVCMWGNPEWIFVAALHVYFAFVFARYPAVAVFYAVVLPVGSVVALLEARPVPWDGYLVFAGACVLAFAFALGIRMVFAIVWQTLRVVSALAKTVAVVGLIMWVLTAVAGAPFAVPIAALTLGGLASAFWAAIFAYSLLHGLASNLDERADRFLDSITLPPFDWNRTPIGRLEAHALKRREQRARESSSTKH